MKKPRSLERDVLMEALVGPPGTALDYDYLSNLVGGSVRHGGKFAGALDSARRDALSQRGEVWDRRWTRLVRLSDEEIPHSRGTRRVKTIRTRARRMVQELRVAVREEQSEAARRESDAALTTAGLFLLFTSRDGQKKITTVVTEANSAKPSAAVLPIFGEETKP
jgi:hypothetical protein